jgi:hypothetical protein
VHLVVNIALILLRHISRLTFGTYLPAGGMGDFYASILTLVIGYMLADSSLKNPHHQPLISFVIIFLLSCIAIGIKDK